MNPDEKQGKLDEMQDQRISNPRSVVKPTIITMSVLAVVVAAVFLAIIGTREKSVSDFLTQWKETVESGDAQAYAEICSDEFKKNFEDMYEETKELITGKGVSVSIEDEDIEKVRLDDKHYVIKHIPVTLADGDIKTYQELYIKRKGLIDRRWKIDREEHGFSKEIQEELKQMVQEQPAEISLEPAETPRDTEFRIRQTLEVWRVAWEHKDLNGYMGCYADYADITRVTVASGKEEQVKLTKNELRDHMDRLNKKYNRIQVRFSEPVEVEGDTAEARANFLQEFSSWSGSDEEPVYKDFGTKELQFVRHDAQWKITNENWTIYEGVPIYPEREY
jgi:ketosteroid isomerase-like protein